MPNWCLNNVKIRHKDPAMIDRIVRGKDGVLTEFFPCPAELHEHDAPMRDEDLSKQFLEKYGATDWYNWQVQNWGTKWDVAFESIEREDPNTVSGSFDSAWSPPIEAYEKFCALGFEIEAHYYEPGMQFCGTWTGNEDDTCDDYFELSGLNSETVRDVIGDDLDEMFLISESMAEWEEENREDEDLDDVKLPPHTD